MAIHNFQGALSWTPTCHGSLPQAVREEKRAARIRAKSQAADAEVPTLPIPHFLPITRWCVAHHLFGLLLFPIAHDLISSPWNHRTPVLIKAQLPSTAGAVTTLLLLCA